ncbi:MAG TPA: ABC transporter substrate-binding protein [Alphaproteobacteria bacterium]|nr:ABC transporter substrate-binding protein [Alphaproteobacteria bacterium]
MPRGMLAILTLLVLLVVACGGLMAAAPAPATTPILSGPLATLDIKPAELEPERGKPKGRLTIAQHYALDPGWLDPQERQAAATQQVYDYLVHDALIKPMPQGLYTYSLAEHAEMTADFTKAAFRLRAGLTFHDGHPLTTQDVQWTYENYRGVNFKIFHDKLERIERVDERTIIFHFKEPFIEFMDLYNGGSTGIGWIVPRHYYEQVGKDGFKARPIGAGPYKFVSQEAGVQMVFEAWDEYWRRTPATKTIVVKGIRDLPARMAGLQTGELDLAFGMTGKLLARVMADRNLRWDPNLTAPWWLAFPGYNEPDSPFHDKRVRQAVSLAINRQFLALQETQGSGIPWGNWIGPEYSGALKGDGTDLPLPEYDPEQAKRLLAQAGFPGGFAFDWYVPWVPYFEMGERILTDLGAVGIRGKLEILEGPAYRVKLGQGRKGYAGNRTIVQIIGSRPGGAKDTVSVYAVCEGSAPFICEPKIEELWAQHQASTNLDERDRLIKAIQRIIIEEYYFVPIYINSFVHAVGPRVLPAGDGFHRYWATPQAGYPVPWEVWEVKE